jgi:hypothetical protein
MSFSQTSKLVVSSLLLLGLAIAGIQAAPQSTGDLVPKSIAGMKMKYSDLHGNYTVVFKEDGSYSFLTAREGEKPEERTGKYKWQVKGSNSAKLDLDDETYALKFHSPGQATGQVTDDVRTYKFTFTK